MMQNFTKVQKSVAFIREQLGHRPAPTVVVQAGTGLGRLLEELDSFLRIEYEDIPEFPHSTVESHSGTLAAGTLGGVPVWVLGGRFHLYEGYHPGQIAMGVRTLAELGACTLITTNAAGCLRTQWDAGAVMCIADHINMTGQSPLTGPNHDPWGPRFPDMCCVYSQRLRELASEEALRLGLRLEHGVYVGVRGPQMETPAETRMLRMLGADAVGMSTIQEVIAARHMSMEVLGFSCLTNKNLPDCMEPAPLEEVIRVANAAGGDVLRLIKAVLRRL